MRKRKVLKAVYWALGYAFGILLGTEKTIGWLIVVAITLFVMAIDTED